MKHHETIWEELDIDCRGLLDEDIFNHKPASEASRVGASIKTMERWLLKCLLSACPMLEDPKPSRFRTKALDNGSGPAVFFGRSAGEVFWCVWLVACNSSISSAAAWLEIVIPGHSNLRNFKRIKLAWNVRSRRPSHLNFCTWTVYRAFRAYWNIKKSVGYFGYGVPQSGPSHRALSLKKNWKKTLSSGSLSPKPRVSQLSIITHNIYIIIMV